MDLRKAISPILATVILIAVTLVIAIGVIGWIMGVWGSIGGPSESLVVTGGYTNCTDNKRKLIINFTVTNKGTADANIIRVEVPGFGATTSITCDGGDTTIPKGVTKMCKVEISSTATCMLGASYDVRVYTQAGNVYPTRVSVSEVK